MKKLLLPAAACVVALGSWSGWLAGSARSSSLARVMAGPPLTAGNRSTALPGGPVPGSVTLQEWRDLIETDPQESRSDDAVHMARVRELARGLSLADLRERIEAGMEETILKNSSSGIVGTLIHEFARRDAAGTCDLLFRKKYWRSDGKVFEQWGRQDPQAAFAWLDAHPQFQSNRYEIIRGWAENDPAGAFQALVGLGKKDQLDASDAGSDRFSFFDSWAQKDPEAAVAACASHPELDFCLNAHWSGALFESSPARQERLLSAIQAIPEPDHRFSALTWCATYLAASEDPRRAIPLTEDQSLSDSQRDRMRQGVLEIWMQVEGAETAAQWFWTSSAPGQQEEAVKRVLDAWSYYSDRLAGPLNWLQNLPPGKIPATAPQIFAEAGFETAPVPALQGWLALQPAGEISPDAVTRLGQYLSSAPQATRLPVLLQDAGFPVELAGRLLHAAGQTGE
ncbi:MAG: hypothetical protein V4726_22795 [Verrucomicrobiota bacterium]